MADTFQARPNGTILLVIGDARYDLRRPTLGESRGFRERLLEMGEQVLDSDGAPAPLTPPERVAKEEALVDWWRSVVETLDTDGRTMQQASDDLPAWLLGPRIIPDVLECWLSRPSPPGR